MMSKDLAFAVREFTMAAEQPTPNVPEIMNKEEVFFVAEMMLDEIMELMATVSKPNEYKEALYNMILNSRDLELDLNRMEEDEIIAEQADAIVDCMYYGLNATAKKGINITSVFNVVHSANMAKKDKETGKFLRREDGKIIKPIGWQPPDIVSEIKRQKKDGSFKRIIESFKY